ncbi:MAG TPA: GntG family PLP-dependent aldolase [Gemmatimonadaceae bacterium]|nr:GntG family PLP-dependent aldolase [Gemmatimonadaceae bacterium]
MTSAIDLRSDTVTRPTPAMRRAIAEAEVGDDVLDGDPTVRRLEEHVAAMLGKEQALFFPSGTMANQAAIWVLAERGSEMYADAGAHVVHYEMAAAAAIGGVQIRTVAPSGDVMSAEDLEQTLRPPSKHSPRASLVCVENTHNGAGGRVTSLPALRAIHEIATERGIPVHLDGARLWNAAEASQTPLDAYASCAETVMVSFSKGLGAPVGAALAGSGRVIEAAHAARKRLGGGMRQSGILAAGALYGLSVHLPRLAEDHEHARVFASALEGMHGIRVVPPDTNIVMLDLPAGVDAFAIVHAAALDSVLLTPWSRTRIRAVTHLDVDVSAVLKAAEATGAAMRAVERGAGPGAGARG